VHHARRERLDGGARLVGEQRGEQGERVLAQAERRVGGVRQLGQRGQGEVQARMEGPGEPAAEAERAEEPQRSSSPFLARRVLRVERAQ